MADNLEQISRLLEDVESEWEKALEQKADPEWEVKTPKKRLQAQFKSYRNPSDPEYAPIHRDWFKSVLKKSRNAIYKLERMGWRIPDPMEVSLEVCSTTMMEREILSKISQREPPDRHQGLITKITSDNALDYLNQVEVNILYPTVEYWKDNQSFRKSMEGKAASLNENIPKESEAKRIILARLNSDSIRETAKKTGLPEYTVQRTLKRFYRQAQMEYIDEEKEDDNDSGSRLSKVLQAKYLFSSPTLSTEWADFERFLTPEERNLLSILLEGKEPKEIVPLGIPGMTSLPAISRLCTSMRRKAAECFSNIDHPV